MVNPLSGIDINPAPNLKTDNLKKAAQGFESYFVDEMFKEMRKTVDKDPLVEDQGHERETFQEMLDQKVADDVSHRGDFGLANMLYHQLSPTVEAAPGTGEPDPEKTALSTLPPVHAAKTGK